MKTQKIILLQLITILFMIAEVVSKNSGQVNGEIKPVHAKALCGDQFINTWKTICQLKLKRRDKRSLQLDNKRNIEEFKKFSKYVIPSNEANNYLQDGRNRRDAISGRWDNGTEECCKEKCTLGEVAEYSC